MKRRLAACLSTLVLGVAALAGGGCGSSDAAAPTVEPGAPAGDVREVSGSVTARRGDASARPLAVGDVVSGDDIIETAADASVVIELRHNGARWSLGAAQSKQVAASLAWKAPRGDGTASVGADRSTAAGRLAEREGADTASTAVATERAAAAPTAAPRAEATTAAPTAATPPPPVAAPPPAPAPTQPAEPVEEKPAPKGGPPDVQPPAPADVDNEVRGFGDVAAVAVAGTARLTGVTVTGALSRVQARGHIARHLTEVTACWAEQVRGGAATAAGTAELVLTVDGAGAVTAVDGKLDAAAEPARACIVAAAQAWTFPGADRGSEVHASFALRLD